MASSSSTSQVDGTAAVKSDEEIEEMLDRMLTRLALCDDSRLQSLLSNLLPLTISSLSSPSLSIRKKVLEILSHVNKRVKYRVEIGLPLLDLWKLYSGSTAFAMVRNFCIVYIEMAFERASAEEKQSMAPMLLASVSKLPNQHQEIILRIVTGVIGECHSNRIDDGAATAFSKISSEDRDVFLEFCLHTILYQPRQACPPGLSIALADRVTGKKALDGDVLLKRKLGILNVIEAMELPAELVYSIYVCASADSQELVIKRGEGLVKKKASSANLDDPNLINRLFTLLNGPTVTGTVAPESKVQPGNITLRMKLLSIFCRSVTAANSFPSTLQCIFGCMYGSTTTPRLKQMGMEFTVWVFKHARIDQLKLMGPLILKGILRSLDGASNSETDPFGRDTKTFAFQAIGLLAPRMPELFRDTIDMAIRLFDALKSESQSQRLVVQEATNSLATAYKSASSAVLRSLENLLLSSYHAEQSEVRFCVVRWATSLYDLDNCPSRFLCMLGAADSKLDVREMALEGLFPGKNDVNRASSQNVDLNFPRLGEMLDYITKQQPKLLDSTEVRVQNLLFPSKMYVAMIKFLLKCFEAEIERGNTTLAASEFQSSVKTMCSLLEHGMAYEGSVELHANAAKGLVTIASHLPELIASRYAVKISFLKQLLDHVDFDTRESTARLLGIASSAFSISESCGLLSELKSSVSGMQNLRFEIQHGVLSATGYVAADFVSRTHSAPEVLQDTLKFLVGVVNSETATLASVAMEALGHIGLRIQLPLIVHDSSSVQVLTALSEKLSKLLSGDDIKAIQRTVISLGHLCMNETSSSQLTIALNLIFGLCRSKVEDILFAAGEALSFLWGGVPVSADEILRTNYNSLSMSSKFLTGDLSSSLSKYRSSEESESHEQYHALVRDTITRKLFDDLLYSSRKEERCAGTVWLLSLTMYCGKHPTIQGMLPEIQEAFSHLLGEQNELTQELASQGMSIVYELGDETMKKNLVNALVGTLTGAGKRKRAIKLVEDSEVFQEGSIGEGLNGGKLNTYKELCGLANEMGQPDLIYKFMDLANYQASLNSKRGAAFGFSKIAKQAGDALQPHLRLLVPRLVRYQYDPDKNVQDAMAHIWKSLVADPKKTLDEYFDLVVEDLLVQSGSRLWRSREASCLALADIIQGRRFDQVGKHLKQIWVVAFRAMDDIKETVRKSGDNLCRAVTTLTIRLCDVSLTEQSEASNTMTIVLPFLLAEGILSKVDSIRKASIGIVMKLAKGAGIAIRPHLPDLVCCMLESLSSLEDQGMNYVELHADKVGIQTDKLENLRISIAKGSPMWETLDLCIKVIDTQSLDLLVPRLAQLVRSGVGLNTRVGVANFISSLLQKVHGDIKPFSSMLLRLLFPVVRDDKSIAVKRAFASACGMVLKYAAPSQAQKLIEDTAALHAGDRNAQIACAVLLKSYSSLATDVISGYQAVLVPAIFITRFEDDKYVSGLYEELWEENTSSERVTLQLYMEEIVSLICESIRSSSWARKKKAAQAIVKLSEVLGESLSFHHHILLGSVMVEIHGRLWEGKEALLHAIGALSTSGHKEISDKDPATPSAILSLVTTACKKKVKKYREAAFGCLEQVIKAFNNPEFFIVVFPLLHEMIDSATSSKPGKVHSSSDVVNTGTLAAETEEVEDFSAPHDKVLNCITSCIHVGDLKSIIEQKKKLIHVFLSSLSPGSLWNAKLAVFSAINEVSSRIQNRMDDSQEAAQREAAIWFIQELFHSVSPEVVECLKTVKIAQVHIAASECLLEMTKLYCSLPSEHQTDIGFRNELVFQCEVEKNEQAKSLLQKCIDSLDSLK